MNPRECDEAISNANTQRLRVYNDSLVFAHARRPPIQENHFLGWDPHSFSTIKMKIPLMSITQSTRALAPNVENSRAHKYAS